MPYQSKLEEKIGDLPFTKEIKSLATTKNVKTFFNNKIYTHKFFTSRQITGEFLMEILGLNYLGSIRDEVVILNGLVKNVMGGEIRMALKEGKIIKYNNYTYKVM